MRNYIYIYCFVLVGIVLLGSCSPQFKTEVHTVEGNSPNRYIVTQQVNQEAVGNLPEKVLLSHVPFIKQLPELRRGCEVTSLAMVLQSANIQVDKMTLASKIQKVPFRTGDKHGNPHKGFVGNIYTYKEPGYGVYHEPIYTLAQQYLGEQAVDLTGKSIEELYTTLRSGAPVLVITNSTFKPLPESKFQVWQTEQGPIRITYHEHSVVMTGFEDDIVYIHNPLWNNPHTAVSKKEFEMAWEQMGKQAISYRINE